MLMYLLSPLKHPDKTHQHQPEGLWTQHCTVGNVSMEVAKLLSPYVCQLMSQLPSNRECYWSNGSLFHSSFLFTPTEMSEFTVETQEISSILQSRWWSSSAPFLLNLPMVACFHAQSAPIKHKSGQKKQKAMEAEKFISQLCSQGCTEKG